MRRTGMAERPGLVEAWTRALEANARYYQALGELTSNWLRELAGLGSAVRLPRVTVLPGAAAPAPRPSAPYPSAPRPGARQVPPGGPAAGPPTPAASLVLEAAAGERAAGAFLVENTLGRRVEQPVEAGPFTDAAGGRAPLPLEFSPATVGLDPGEQVVVRVTVVVPDTLQGDHRGTARVAGVPHAEIPVVVRRIAGEPGADAPGAGGPGAGGPPAPGAAR